MGWSATALSEGQSVDEVSPGAPSFVNVSQVDNHNWELGIQLPLQDSDGTSLTGLTMLKVATLPMTEGANPFIGLSIDEIANLPGVVVNEVGLTPSDAGTVATINVPIMNLGGFQAFAAAVSDA